METEQKKMKLVQYAKDLEQMEKGFKYFLLELHEWRNKLAYNIAIAESVDTKEFLEMKANLKVLNIIIGKAKKLMDVDVYNTVKISENKEYYKLEEE